MGVVEQAGILVILDEEWVLFILALHTLAFLEALLQNHLGVKLLENPKQPVTRNAFQLSFQRLDSG